MEKRTGIQREYVRVSRKENAVLTYGGDQGFFGSGEASKEDRRKKESGCGIIAFADLLLYLGNRDSTYRIPETEPYLNRALRQEEYQNYYNAIYRFLGGLPFKGGISGLRLTLMFNRLSLRQGFGLRAVWGLSGKKVFPRVRQMLLQDIPVILCIPMMLLKKDKRDGIRLYGREEERGGNFCYQEKAFTRAHYVMVTGIVEEEREAYYEISSWGKKYYMSCGEYDILIRTHFLGTILGNILLIRQRKHQTNSRKRHGG